ncbi:probable serine/threonine-protein kinase clkA [Gordionus sp. m RMFG-2023]|uniref:probable serine/threonine-protein kinase clkA n=1 Tax=Gordionus sp. m RMFG-2023 TaxID=3053472 RepID=UPI0031FDB2B9
MFTYRLHQSIDIDCKIQVITPEEIYKGRKTEENKQVVRYGDHHERQNLQSNYDNRQRWTTRGHDFQRNNYQGNNYNPRYQNYNASYYNNVRANYPGSYNNFSGFDNRTSYNNNNYNNHRFNNDYNYRYNRHNDSRFIQIHKNNHNIGNQGRNQTKLQFLRHDIDHKGIHPNADKIKAISNMSEPKTKEELALFWGWRAIIENFYLMLCGSKLMNYPSDD